MRTKFKIRTEPDLIRCTPFVTWKTDKRIYLYCQKHGCRVYSFRSRGSRRRGRHVDTLMALFKKVWLIRTCK